MVDIAQASVAVKRIRALRAPVDTDSSSDTLANEEEDKGIKGPKIELRNVWFQYPTRDVPVLRGLNMTVSAFSNMFSGFYLTILD
jgi:ATP-binding cassette, subfamily B (MDR/TAP), member 1